MNPFRAHYEYGSVENCITRLEICIKTIAFAKKEIMIVFMNII